MGPGRDHGGWGFGLGSKERRDLGVGSRTLSLCRNEGAGDCWPPQSTSLTSSQEEGSGEPLGTREPHLACPWDTEATGSGRRVH